MAIEIFRGEHYYLSSMYPLPNGVMAMDGAILPSVEVAYQREKFITFQDREAVRSATDGLDAKRIARNLEKELGRPIREDWYDCGRLKTMKTLVELKFDRNPDLAEKLIATGSEDIYEGNTWNDTFWGVCPPGSRNGENWLGQILMGVRNRIQGSVNLEDKKIQGTFLGCVIDT